MPRFTDESWIKQVAKKSPDDGLIRLKRWWSKKYDLPANHELFEKQTINELLQEWYEDMVFRRLELLDRLETEDLSFDESNVLRRQIESIDKILAEEGEEDEFEDDLIDKWERELEAGEVPDLDEGIEDGE